MEAELLDKTVFIRVDDYAAALNPGQQLVFAVLCKRILEKGCEQEPWVPEEAQIVRGDRVGA